MVNSVKRKTSTNAKLERKAPPGRTKIINALKLLLDKKSFGAITIHEIAKTAGVADALLYKYFEGKRDLLHEVLMGYLSPFMEKMKEEADKATGAKNKLRAVIRIHFDIYYSDRVFARIFLLEVRNYPAYFRSSAYAVVRRYSRLILEIVKEGVENREIRDDISLTLMRQLIIGGIEHFMLPGIIFDKDVDPDFLSDNLCSLIFRGIERDSAGP